MRAALTKRAESLRRRRAHACCATRTSAMPASRATARRSTIRFRDARHADAGASACWPTRCPTCNGPRAADGSRRQAHRHAQAGGRARACRSRRCKQNITTLHNRVNELGVAEPVIQQQGADRVVVQLPGVQDTAKAKDIIGRTANLEFRLADMTRRGARRARRPRAGAVRPRALRRRPRRAGDRPPRGGRLGRHADRRASRARDQYNQPAVSVTLDAKGGRRMLRR